MCVLASVPVGLVADGQSTATSIPLGFSPPTLRSMQLLGSSSARGGGDFQLTGQGKGAVLLLCCTIALGIREAYGSALRGCSGFLFCALHVPYESVTCASLLLPPPHAHTVANQVSYHVRI